MQFEHMGSIGPHTMHLVSSTKSLIQKFRDDGWDGLLTTVISFCEKRCIDVLDMNARLFRGEVELVLSKITLQLSIIIE